MVIKATSSSIGFYSGAALHYLTAFRKAEQRMSRMTIEALHQFQNLVITQPNCPYCVRAKAILDGRGTDYTTLVLGQDLEKTEMVAFIEQVANTTVRTVPQIILDGRYIGGHDDLVAFLERQVDHDALSDFEL
ncbi:hypothetical protein PSSHI_03610 [Photobacterium sp. R1]